MAAPVIATALTAVGLLFVTRMVTALGIGVITYSIVDNYVQQAFDFMASAWAGIPADIAQVLAIMGVGEAFSIIASGMSVFMAFKSARFAFGMR